MMKKSTSLFVLLTCSFLLLASSLTQAAPSQQEQVELVFESMELFEENLRHANWAVAGQAVDQFENNLLQLVQISQVDNKDSYKKKIKSLTNGLREAVAEKSEEEAEIPFHACQKKMLQVMNQMEYSKPPVFILIRHHVEESLKHLHEGHFDAISDEMEEVVNFREDAKLAGEKANINPTKVQALLDLAWNVSSDCENKNTPSAQKRLDRMKLILASI